MDSTLGDGLKRLAALGTAALIGFAAAHLLHDMRGLMQSMPAAGNPAVAASPGYAGKCVLITGAGSGIGRATALRLARSGARLAIHYNRSAKAAAETAALCKLAGSAEAVLFQGELAGADPAASASALLARVLAHFGRIDVAVLNAGIYEELAVLAPAGEEGEGGAYQFFVAWWTRTLRTNLDAPAFLAFLLARHMAGRRARGQGQGEARTGAIVFVGSRGAYRGEAGAVAYGASKAGLHSLSQSLAVALAPAGVVVAAVAPGFIDTPMASGALSGLNGSAIRSQSGWGRVGSAEEVAAAIAFLGAYWDCPWVTGAVLDCNGASYLH
jgi:3-oxoacyl-[acyl-carrier protein] reductase